MVVLGGLRLEGVAVVEEETAPFVAVHRTSVPSDLEGGPQRLVDALGVPVEGQVEK